MTTGSMLYLAMSIGMFLIFSIVLGYQAWQQSRLGPDVVPIRASHTDSHGAVSNERAVA